MSKTRRFLVAALLLLCVGGSATAAEVRPVEKGPANVAVIRLTGEVDDFMRDVLFKQFRRAQTAGAKVVILEIDTYGGLVTSGMDISSFLRGQTDLHTIAFVHTKAISAGAMIALACDEIVMAPGSRMGDCAPIMLDDKGHLESLADTERAKIQSPILRDFADSAARNGYDPQLAQAMVKIGSDLYLITDGKGTDRVVEDAEYHKLTASGDWKPAPDVPAPFDHKDELLTVGPELAQKLGLSRGSARSAEGLAAERGFSIVADMTPGIGDQLVQTLNTAGARFLLIVVFLMSLYIVLHAPGHGAAEAVAIVSLALLVGIPLLTGFAQWWQIALIFAGLGLCAFEVLVFPGHFVSITVGLIMVLGGLLLTFAGREPNPTWIPHLPGTWMHLMSGVRVVAGGLFTAVAISFALRPFLPKMPLFRRLILTETSPGRLVAAGAPLKAGEDVWPFVGTIGTASTDLKPGGLVVFPYGSDSRSAPVVCTSGFVSAGNKVVVQEARGNRIVVRIS